MEPATGAGVGVVGPEGAGVPPSRNDQRPGTPVRTVSCECREGSMATFRPAAGCRRLAGHLPLVDLTAGDLVRSGWRESNARLQLGELLFCH